MSRETMGADMAEYAANNEEIKKDFESISHTYQEAKDSLSGESLYEQLRKDRQFFQELEREI